MATIRDRDSTHAAALADLFRCQAALNSALSRWQAQWSQPGPSRSISLQEVGLAVSFCRCGDGLYSATLLHEQGASLESGCCSTPIEAYLLVLGIEKPHTLVIR
jgi:hypothetical protein